MSARGPSFEKVSGLCIFVSISVARPFVHVCVWCVVGLVGVLESQLEADSPPARPAGAPARRPVQRVKTHRLKCTLQGWKCRYCRPSAATWTGFFLKYIYIFAPIKEFIHIH